MAICDYIICCKCEVKLLYDGDRGNREWWKERFGAEPKIKCPDCEKEEQDEPVALQLATLIDENQRLRAELKFNTTPQQRTWVELTDDEQMSLLKESDGKTRHWLVWQVEAKLKQNNGYNT